MPVQHARCSGQAQHAASPEKNQVTSKSPVGDISVVTLIRTDTTLDHSQKAEKVWLAFQCIAMFLLGSTWHKPRYGVDTMPKRVPFLQNKRVWTTAQERHLEHWLLCVMLAAAHKQTAS